MHRADIDIVGAHVLGGEFEQYPVASWVDECAYVGEEGLLEVDRILRDELNDLRRRLLSASDRTLYGHSGCPSGSGIRPSRRKDRAPRSVSP